jgi:hypothetical protein
VTADWPALEKLLGAGDTGGVLAAVRDLDAKQRSALSNPLQEYAKRSLAQDPDGAHDWVERSRWQSRIAPALMVAGAGCLAGASAVTAWLVLTGRWGGDDRAVLEVLRARLPAWRDELALRLAGQRRLADGHLRDLAVALVAETGVEPPATNGFAAAWVATLWFAPVPLADALREDPLLPHACRLLFEPDEVGSLLGRANRPDFAPALVALAGEGRLDRGLIIDACLGRMLRGGTPGQLRTYLQIYQGLQVGVDEAATRTRDLLALLPDSLSTVAALAQAELHRIDEAGMLTTQTLAQASRSALSRPEKKLAAAQLSWLGAAIGRDLGRAPALLSAVTVAFGHPASEIQQQAVALLAQHAQRLDAETRAQAAAAACSLPGDLHSRLTGVLGDALAGNQPAGNGPVREVPRTARTVVRPVAVTPGLAPPFTPAGMPAPITSPAELAEEVSAMLETVGEAARHATVVDPVAMERILAGLVALTHADSAEVAAALAPVCSRRREIQPGLPERLPTDRYSRDWSPEAGLLFQVVVGAAAGRGDPGRVAGWAGQIAVIDRVTAPLRVLMRRLLEIAAGLAAGPVPMLVATPTAAAGHLDPTALLGRLEQAAEQRWHPWEYDLQQALLRLPRETSPQVAAAGRRLGTPAGSRLADWLEDGGLPDLPLQRAVYQPHFWHTDGKPAGLSETTVVVVVPAEPRLPLRAAPHSLARMLLTLSDPRQEKGPSQLIERWEWAACWPAVAPSHRDLIAAYLPRPWESGVYEGAELPFLAEADGPVGPGISLAIAGGLGADSEMARAATVDGMLVLARRGQLDGAPVGADIAALVNLGHRTLTRVVPRLHDAARAGAQAQVWDAVAAALPPLLTAALDKPANGLADLIALGTELAPAAGAATHIPELASYAEQKKTTRLATEARRLHARLTRAPA